MGQVELKQKLIEFISNRVIADENIKFSSSTKLSNLGIESIEIMEVVLFIESLLKCKLPTEFVFQQNIESVDSMVEFIECYVTQS